MEPSAALITRKQTIAAATAAAAIAVIGGTGVAMAANTPAPVAPSAVITTSDGADQGPDANLTEPGHQDASEANDPAESADAAGGTEASDGADQGPDANPTEPGHQDAN
jgi:hypothetical protein